MDELLHAATEARARAYAPYSRFPVGAALRTASGRVFAGANVENAAYPLGQCAEASAIGAMVTAGETRIVEVLVIGGGEAPCTPCGGCRQRLAELASAATPVHLFGPEGLRLATTLGELLPHAFGLDRPTVAAGVTDPTDASPSDPVNVVRSRAPGFTPVVGLVLGSGLGAVEQAIENPVTIPYTDLPGFPRPSVPGHAGRVVLGRLHGVPVAGLVGRVHLYEGGSASAIDPLVRTLAGLGCRTLVLTNAAGSLRPEVGPGSLVLIEDHINLLGTNPLVGQRGPDGGPLFLDMSEVYDASLRGILREAGERAGVPLASGVYLATLGPCFETPAEIRAFRALGADLVGMSTVPEAIAARRHELRVAAISIVTNLAAGMAGTPLSHAETLAQGAQAAERLARLLAHALPEMADAPA